MKSLTGIVTSAKTLKTVTVEVTRKWKHPIYKKFVKSTKKYACHVEGIEVKEGDKVSIHTCRPMSRTKRFKVVAKVEV